LDKPVTLTLLDAKIETINVRLSGMDKALSLQAIEMERRLKGLNNLREEFSRRSGSFVEKEAFKQLELKVGKHGTWGSIIAALIALLQVALILLRWRQ
jgi:hypothetical protein